MAFVEFIDIARTFSNQQLSFLLFRYAFSLSCFSLTMCVCLSLSLSISCVHRQFPFFLSISGEKMSTCICVSVTKIKMKRKFIGKWCNLNRRKIKGVYTSIVDDSKIKYLKRWMISIYISSFRIITHRIFRFGVSKRETKREKEEKKIPSFCHC